MQYLELLSAANPNGDDEFFNSIVPSLAELGQQYGIRPAICMQIIRPTLVAPLKVS